MMSDRPSVFRLTLPLPPRACRAQNNGNAIYKSGPISKARELACFAAKEKHAGNPSMGMVDIEVTFYIDPTEAKRLKAYAPMDAQNAGSAAKAYIDGIVDAGVIPDDSYRHVQWFCSRVARGKEAKGMAKVVIVLREVQDNETA